MTDKEIQDETLNIMKILGLIGDKQ